MRHRRKAVVGGVASAMAMVLLAATAWACVAGPSAFTSTVNVKAGETLQMTGVDFSDKAPVLVRFDALDGPVVADLGLPSEDRGLVSGDVTIPAGTAPGDYVLIMTQAEAGGESIQIPVRSLVSVVGDTGAAPILGAELGANDQARVAELAVDDNEIGVGVLVLLAGGVAGVGLLLAGGAAMAAGRRNSAAATEKVEA